MSSSRTDMERELKSAVVPWLRAMGFRGAFPHLRRPGDSAIDLLTFQLDRHGGAFIVEIARCSPEGVVTHWGKVISADKAKAWDVHPWRRKRIAAESKPGTEGWFRFEREAPKQIAALVLAKLADENIWRDIEAA